MHKHYLHKLLFKLINSKIIVVDKSHFTKARRYEQLVGSRLTVRLSLVAPFAQSPRVLFLILSTRTTSAPFDRDFLSVKPPAELATDSAKLIGKSTSNIL